MASSSGVQSISPLSSSSTNVALASAFVQCRKNSVTARVSRGSSTSMSGETKNETWKSASGPHEYGRATTVNCSRMIGLLSEGQAVVVPQW